MSLACIGSAGLLETDDGAPDCRCIDRAISILGDKGHRPRRVETVHLLTPTLRRRRLSMDFHWESDEAFGNDMHRLLPLLVLPKGLLFDLDVSVDGERARVATRFTDAKIASATVIRAAQRLSGDGSLPPQGARDLIEEICRDFPDTEGSAAKAVRDLGIDGIVQEFHTVHFCKLDDASKRWWLEASQHADWRRLVETFADRFIMTIEIPGDAPAPRSVKIDRLEAASESEDPWMAAMMSDPILFNYTTVKFFDAGRCRSEHFRVTAPEGIYFSDPLLDVPRGVGFMDQSSGDRLVFYSNELPRGDVTAGGALWPTREDFVTPALFISTFALFVLIAGSVAQAILLWLGGFDVVDHLAGQADAVVALFFIAPSVALAFSSGTGMGALRWNLTRAWRGRAIRATMAVAPASLTLVLDSAYTRGYWAAIEWGVLALWSFFFWSALVIRWRQSQAAEAEAKLLADRRITYDLPEPE